MKYFFETIRVVIFFSMPPVMHISMVNQPLPSQHQFYATYKDICSRLPLAMLSILSQFWNNEIGHTGYCLTEYSRWMVATSGETGLHNNRVPAHSSCRRSPTAHTIVRNLEAIHALQFNLPYFIRTVNKCKPTAFK